MVATFLKLCRGAIANPSKLRFSRESTYSLGSCFLPTVSIGCMKSKLCLGHVSVLTGSYMLSQDEILAQDILEPKTSVASETSPRTRSPIRTTLQTKEISKYTLFTPIMARTPRDLMY